MPRSSVSPSSGADIKFYTPGHCETPCDGDDLIVGDLVAQTDFHIKSEVHRELRTHFNLSPDKLARVTQSHLKKLLFYRLVEGGNIDIVSSILGEIRQVDKTWHEYLISGKRPSNELPQCDKEKKSSCCSFVFISLVIYYFLMVPFFIITTPIFYTMHSLFLGMYTNRKISKFSRFPLLFAAMSNSQPILQLFAENHPNNLSVTDEEGNNLFHYLADLSIKKPEKAMQCMKLIQKTFVFSQIRNVLLDAKNFNGFTALEQSILKGSPLYFTLLLETQGILKSTVLAVSENSVYFNRNTTAVSVDTMSVVLQELSPPSNYRKTNESRNIGGTKDYLNESCKVFHYDITKYEQGDVFGDNSFLLTLLTRRDVTTMTDLEIESIASSSFLTQWMRIKIKSVTTIRTLQFIVSNVLVQIFLIYTIKVGGADNTERLVISFWSTVNQLAMNNATNKYSTHQTISNTSDITFNNFLSPALDVLNTACGFDVSQLLPNENTTSVDILDPTLELAWLMAGFFSLVSIISVISDLYSRLVFLTKHFFYSGWRKELLKHSVMIRRVMSRPMQVSYIERQFLILSYIFCVLMMYCFLCSRQTSAVDVDSANEKSTLRTAGMILAVACMSSRFFALLYTFRAAEMMNFAGRFVLTMCKMFSIIIEFSWVYIWVSAFFAGIFMFIVYDPVCVYKHFYPFDSFPNSMIGVFQLMMSDNVLPDRPPIETLFAYVIYINLTTIVVLSLVTGISGSIADKVLSKKILGILQVIESLECAIEAESSSYVGPLQLFRYFHLKRLRNGNKVISVIDKQLNILKVAIEVKSFFPSMVETQET